MNHSVETNHFQWLEHIHNSPHITLAQPKNSSDSIMGYFNIFILTNIFNSSDCIIKRYLLELKPSASRLKGRNDLRNVVRNETKSSVACILFDNCDISNNLLLLNANCEACVIISASSKMINFRFKFLHKPPITKKEFCWKRSFLFHFWPHRYLFRHLHSILRPFSCNLSCIGLLPVLWLLRFFLCLVDHKRANLVHCWIMWSFWLCRCWSTSCKDAFMGDEIG